MPSENGVKIIKSPIVQTQEGGFLEHAYQDTIIYYVRLSNGIVITRPEDFPTNKEENEGSSASEVENQDQTCEEPPRDS
jgi:hypothetical protein